MKPDKILIAKQHKTIEELKAELTYWKETAQYWKELAQNWEDIAHTFEHEYKHLKELNKTLDKKNTK